MGLSLHSVAPQETAWTVITGAPSSGKTTTIAELARRGRQVRAEPGTLYIEAQFALGRRLEQIVADQRALQRAIFAKGLAMDDLLDPACPMVLDRGCMDPLAYCRLYDLDPAPILAALPRRRYAKVLLLDRLPLEANHVRIEDDATADRIDRLLEEVYAELGYPVTRIPVLPFQERLALVEGHLVRSV